MGEALRDCTRPVPVPCLVTVLVLDEHFSDFERRKGPGRPVRLLPLGVKLVPVSALFELPGRSPCGLHCFIAELVGHRHELEGVREPSAVDHFAGDSFVSG